MKFGSGQGFMIGGGVVILILVIIVIVLGTKKSDSPVCPAVGSCPAGSCPAGERCPECPNSGCPAGQSCRSKCPAGEECPTCNFENAPINIAWELPAETQQWNEDSKAKFCTARGSGTYPKCDDLSNKVKQTPQGKGNTLLARSGGISTQEDCETYCGQQYPCGLNGNTCHAKFLPGQGCQCRLCPGDKNAGPITGMVKSAPGVRGSDGKFILPV